jgi:hypothetical protein
MYNKKVGYLKGLAAGLELDPNSKEGRLFDAVIEALDAMSEAVALKVSPTGIKAAMTCAGVRPVCWPPKGISTVPPPTVEPKRSDKPRREA